MSQMQRIPFHAKEVEKFKPECLADQPDIPEFSLKAPSRRQREGMMYAIRQDGFRRYSQEELREGTIEELCRLWECSENDEQIEKVRAYWQAMDEYNDEADALRLEAAVAKEAGEEAPADLAPFDHPDHAMIMELLERLAERSPRVRRMSIGNVKFQKALPRYAIAHCVTGWTGFDTEPRFEDEVLKIDTVYELEEEAEIRFGELGDVVMAELAAAAVSRFFLAKATEKNLSSGPVSPQTPTASKETGSASKSGKSPDSAPSPETPAA